MSSLVFPYVTIHYDEPVVVFIYKDRTVLGVPELKKMVAAAEKLSDGKPYITFSDVRIDIDLTDPARKFLANPKNMPLFRGSAILVTTTLYSFAVNFAAFFSKTTYPVKAFVTEEKAMEWLRNQSLNERETV